MFRYHDMLDIGHTTGKKLLKDISIYIKDVKISKIIVSAKIISHFSLIPFSSLNIVANRLLLAIYCG